MTLRVESQDDGCWTSTNQGPQDGSVLCCRNCFTAISPWPASSVGRVRVLLRWYSALSGLEVSERLKVALVPKGITDDALILCCTPHAFSNFSLVREEVHSVLITRTADSADRQPVRFGEDEHGDQHRTGHSWADSEGRNVGALNSTSKSANLTQKPSCAVKFLFY